MPTAIQIKFRAVITGLALLLCALILPSAISRGISNPQSGSSPATPRPGSYIAAFRTPKHVTASKPEVFHGIVDDVVTFLQSNQVVIVSDPSRNMIRTEDPISQETLLNITKDAGAAHLLYLTVDRPVTQWVKITLQCFDSSGKVIWEESSNSGSGGLSGKKGVQKALEKLKKQLGSRLGQPGLPIARKAA